VLSQEESYIPSLRSLRRIDMRTTRNPRACNQAAMYRRGYLRIMYFTWPECRVVIENMYLALRKPNDAYDDFWRHGVFAAQMRIDFSLSPAGEDARLPGYFNWELLNYMHIGTWSLTRRSAIRRESWHAWKQVESNRTNT